MFIALSLLGCTKQEGLQNLAATEFQTELKSAEPGQILDVRTSDEYAHGHIEGAILADISSNLFQEAAAKLDKSKTVYVYCLSGGRSSAAATQLQEMGFKSVVNLSGGMLAWQSANLPISTSEGDSAPAAGMTLADFGKQIEGKN